MNIVEQAREQIIFARKYTSRLLETVDPGDWFRMPAEGVSHVAWQVGHLAMADYRLIIERVRGKRPEDESLISSGFLKQFGRDSVPHPDPNEYPPVSTIRSVFDRVRQRVLNELGNISLDELSQPPLTPHMLCKTKQEVLFWCAQHEMMHAGQIGLLRRLFGKPPLW